MSTIRTTYATVQEAEVDGWRRVNHTNDARPHFGFRITVQSLHPDQIAAGHQTVFTIKPGPLPMNIQDALRFIAADLDDIAEYSAELGW